MEILDLYENEQFNNLLSIMAAKKRIVNFDDFRQDVFLEILETGAKCNQDYKRCAWRMAYKHSKENRDLDINILAYENENGDIETDDEVMARLVYSGRGRYV